MTRQEYNKELVALLESIASLLMKHPSGDPAVLTAYQLVKAAQSNLNLVGSRDKDGGN